tara:strand:+ start:56 stop:631 length:576 start_codon:yes stop_codon:yes gene_type:complete
MPQCAARPTKPPNNTNQPKHPQTHRATSRKKKSTRLYHRTPVVAFYVLSIFMLASFLAFALAASDNAAAPAPEHVERVLSAPQAGAERHGRSSDYPRPEPAEHSGCWDEQMEGSFLQTGAAMKPQVDSDKWKQDYNWFSNDKLNAAGKAPNRWADVPKLGLTGPESQPARALLPVSRRPRHWSGSAWAAPR